MLLPSTRALWEAQDEETWGTLAVGDGDRPPPALRLGDLTSADADSSQKKQIATWQEESCEFGMVVMLASQLLMDRDTEVSDHKAVEHEVTSGMLGHSPDISTI